MGLKSANRWCSLLVLLAIATDSEGLSNDISGALQAIASTRLEIPEYVEVSTEIDVVQRVELNRSLPSGTFLIVDQPVYYPWQLQSRQSNEDNYVSVEADVEVVVRTLRRDHVPGLEIGSPLVVIVELLSEMTPGEALTVHYTRLRVPSITYDEFSLPLLISVGEGYHSIPVSRFAIAPGPASRIQVTAPSQLRPGEPFEAHLLLTDNAGNPALGSTPNLEVMVDGVFSRRLLRGESAELVIDNLSFDETGLHRIDVRSAGGSLVGSSDVIHVSEIDQKILWTDLHLHGGGDLTRSGFSVDAVHARNSIALDFMNLIDESENSVELTRPLDRGGNMLLLYGGLQVVLADVPTDYRRLNADKPIFAEILSGYSQHEWLGSSIASLGHRLAFVGSQTSHTPGAAIGQGKTALLVMGGESWMDALSAGRTYVASEGKPVMLLSVNGAPPGSRVPHSLRREIAGEVHASFGLDRIELLRNGILIDEVTPGVSEDANILRVRLSSPSFPKNWDLPRNGREWIGFLRAPGGRLTDLTTQKVGVLHDIAINPADSSRVDFITWTHGGSRSFLVEASIEDNEVPLELSIMEGFEDIAYIPRYRPPSTTPAIRQLFTLEDVRNGDWNRNFETYGYDDLVEISIVDSELPTSYEFRFVDVTDVRAGDYYYVRVLGKEDEMIWSSPVHVGGFDVVE